LGRRSIGPALAGLLVLSLVTPAFATPGHLDAFFSGDGKQTAFPHGSTSYATAIDKQGRIVVAGYTLKSHSDMAVARFLPNGKPDPRFGGGDGRVTVNLGGTDYAFDVALQSDGKIVLAGERDTAAGTAFAVARLGIRGVLDKTFSKDGKAFATFGKTYQGANAVAIGPRGNILVGGFTSNGNESRWALARFGQKGVLDKSFGGDGKVTIDTSATDEQIEDLLITPKGRILASGYSEMGLIPRFSIAQFYSGGKLDKAFGHKGINRLDISKGSDIAYGMARQPDGKILMVGYADAAGKGDWGIVRVGPKGRLDTTFGGGDGIVLTAFGPAYEYAYGVVVQTNGKIVVAGRAVRGDADFCVIRYKPAGGLDLTFGGEGKAFTDFFGGDDTARGVALQSNGKIVVAGEAVSKGVRRMAVARYLAK
jgi:uncharacterized delta-60 repeat protein